MQRRGKPKKVRYCFFKTRPEFIQTRHNINVKRYSCEVKISVKKSEPRPIPCSAAFKGLENDDEKQIQNQVRAIYCLILPNKRIGKIRLKIILSSLNYRPYYGHSHAIPLTEIRFQNLPISLQQLVLTFMTPLKMHYSISILLRNHHNYIF